MNRSLVKQFVPLGIVFLVLFFMMPRNSRFPYDYRRGREWKYETLFAQFDFPIYKTAEQIRDERNSASSEVTPFFKYSDEVVANSIREADEIELGSMRAAVLSEIRALYNKGIIADDGKGAQNVVPESDVIYVQRDKRAVKCPVSEVYRQSEARAVMLSDLSRMSDMNVDSLLRVTGVYNLLVPNIIYDQQTTELVHAESDAGISPTSGYVTAGQLIVSEGEIVTSEVEQMLDSYKREFEASIGYLGPPALLLFGNLLLAAALTVLLYFVIFFCCPHILQDTRYLYVLLVFTISSLLALLVTRTGENFLYLVPFTLMAIMLQAFMKPREIVPVYIVSLVPLLLFSHDGPVLFGMFLVAGLVDIFIFRYFQKGWKQFVAALITFAVLAVMYLGFRAADLVAGGIWNTLLFLFIGSMLNVAGYPVVFLFERVFNLVSNSRLIELCDTSNPLVRQLEQKAPGTFQHALQVMNMADAVARAIDENPDLVRAGALYHDIGKTANPLCFVENESLVAVEAGHRYHDGLSPMQSAQDIIRHVTDGVEIAQKNRLPQVIIDFIRTHHGTTVVRYFYDKFLKEGGDPSQVSEFMYGGIKPRTRAEIILMLCDTVEAASRTLKGNTPEAYSAFIEGLVAGKMDEGQFDNADITISELNSVKETLKQYLAHLNHERIVYPKNKSNKK